MRKKKSEKNVGYNPAARFFLMLFFAVMAILILIPLYALLLGTFKGGAELFVSGLNSFLQLLFCFFLSILHKFLPF